MYSASWSYQLALIYTERIYRILGKFKLECEIVCYYRDTHEFQCESKLYSSLPECQGTPYLKQVPYLKFLSDSNEIGTHIHLVRKRTNLAKMALNVSLAKVECSFTN